MGAMSGIRPTCARWGLRTSGWVAAEIHAIERPFQAVFDRDPRLPAQLARRAADVGGRARDVAGMHGEVPDWGGPAEKAREQLDQASQCNRPGSAEIVDAKAAAVLAAVERGQRAVDD